MKKTTEQTWKEYIAGDPSFQKIIARLSKGIIESSSIVWLKVEAVPIYKLLVDEISKKLKKNITSYFYLSEEDDLLFKFNFLDLLSNQNAEISKGQRIEEVQKLLDNCRLERVSKVWEEGEYSVIGDTMTIWFEGKTYPIRVEYENNKVQKISQIDYDTRKSIIKTDRLTIGKSQKGGPFQVYFSNSNYETNHDIPLIISPKTFITDELDYSFTHISTDINETKWNYKNVKERVKNSWTVMMLVNHNIPNVEEIRDGIPGIKIFQEDFEFGFESKESKTMVLTDHELWGTVKLSKSSRERYSGLALNEITPGDYVVHEDHGVALYGGIKEEERDGAVIKYVELKYAQKDRLLVPLSQLHKITKYIGSGTNTPKLTRLSGGEWKRIKRRVTEAVRKVALELLRLYAARTLTKVKPVGVLNGDLTKFESDFEFVETDDQINAISDVYSDLAKEVPMDRLLVGDVGFGKTEIALRSAFIAVKNGYQVAVLAPTTVLVEQHHQVFKSRMENYGIRVASLSRFLDKREADSVIESLREGKIDVVIGTHKLLSEEVQFKNLGLLVVDEEQKFGVTQKERIKNKKLDVHVLSMSATPIPRTLNMALSGVRDISVITTPPPGRIPIINYIKKFNWEDVVGAIKKEVMRGGQVYFVHNRVSSIGFVYEKLRQMLPNVKFIIAHGQMSSEKLSKAMHDFNSKKYDVLICSTIIENGLDMPNVNTLIIDRAEMFGLSQLYQIRGRIGRGDKQAYAYFFYYGTGGQTVVKRAIEEQESGEIIETEQGILWEEARKRLQAIDELKHLGSGFDLSQRDLEIRGAGNFLGKEQHGNVNSVGFSLYCRLLDEMIEKIRKNGTSTVKKL